MYVRERGIEKKQRERERQVNERETEKGMKRQGERQTE